MNVAETHLYEAYPKMRWFGRSAPNYKQIVSLMTPSSGFYSIDTGNNGNLLAGHYFDRNEAHLKGKLHRMMRVGTSQLNSVPHQTLTLKPVGWKDEPESEKEEVSPDL